MLATEELVVTALHVPAHQTPGLARPSLKVSLSPCFVCLGPLLGFGRVSIFLTLWSSPNALCLRMFALADPCTWNFVPQVLGVGPSSTPAPV